MNTQNTPICMSEEYWVNSPFSIARYYGRIRISGQEYYIVDKRGRDLWECTAAKDRAGSDKAIPPGEPADLVRKEFIPYYKKLGRDKFLSVLKDHPITNDKEMLAIYEEMTKKPNKEKVKQSDLFDSK